MCNLQVALENWSGQNRTGRTACYGPDLMTLPSQSTKVWPRSHYDGLVKLSQACSARTDVLKSADLTACLCSLSLLDTCQPVCPTYTAEQGTEYTMFDFSSELIGYFILVSFCLKVEQDGK